MAEHRKHNAQIARKGLDNTGITEDHARAMGSSLGRATMLIVEAMHAKTTTDSEGNVLVTLTLSHVEPVPAEHEERIRDFQRGLFLQRPEQEGQAVLTGTSGDNEAALDSAAAGVDAAVERDADGQVTGVWSGDPDDGLDTDARPWPGDAPAAGPGAAGDPFTP